MPARPPRPASRRLVPSFLRHFGTRHRRRHRGDGRGTGLNFSPIDPMKAPCWSAVINGIVSVPIMAAMMLLAGNPAVMGRLTVRRKTRWLGWGAVLVMCAAVAMMGRDLVR